MLAFHIFFSLSCFLPLTIKSSPVFKTDDFYSAYVFFPPKQTDEQEVITFLLTTEIIPLCLRIMEAGSELSKTVSMIISPVTPRRPHTIAHICFCPS